MRNTLFSCLISSMLSINDPVLLWKKCFNNIQYKKKNDNNKLYQKSIERITNSKQSKTDLWIDRSYA